MKQKLIKKLYPAGTALIIILISLILAYGTNFSDPISLLVKNFYPRVVVGSGMISIWYWNQGHSLAKNLDPGASPQKVSDQLIKVEEERQLLNSLKIFYSSPSTDEELKYYTTGKTAEYQNLIYKYFNSDEKLFSEFVVKPQVYDALLRIKYNSDFSANTEAYNRTQNIKDQIKSGKSFEDLAKAQSEDKITAQLGGDLGFVVSGEILPELENAVMKAKLGQVSDSIVVSRLGYHILYPVETAEKDGSKLWHIKHILIKTSGFDSWLNPRLNRFWVWSIF